MTATVDTLTDSIYYASLNPACLTLTKNFCIQSTPGLPQYNPNNAQSLLTTSQLTGAPIDTQIMLWGWSPSMTMLIRQNNGYQWVPPWGSSNINVAPGLPPPVGEVSNYPSTMPAGWIKVSTDASDYPPYVPPVTPPTPIVYTPVMNEMLSWTDNGVTSYYYGIQAGQNPVIGQTCTFGGLAFVAAWYPQVGPVGGPTKMWLLTGTA